MKKKDFKDVEKILQKLIIGILKGTKLSNKECIVLIKYINMRDELIKGLQYEHGKRFCYKG